MFGDLFGQDLAIDPGTQSTLVYARGRIQRRARGRELVLFEPSVVAVDEETGRVVDVGWAAKRKLEHAPDYLQAVWPLTDGVVADLEFAGQMLHQFIRKAMRRVYGPLLSPAIKPRVLISVPLGATKVELGAAREAVTAAGARQVRAIEGPLAAAMGAGLAVGGERGEMIVNIGSGRTETAVISFGDIAMGSSGRVAGGAVDTAIRRWIREELRLDIDVQEAERLKIALGGALPLDNEQLGSSRIEPQMIRATHTLTGAPMMAVITNAELCKAARTPVKAIVEAVRGTLERTPPELITDIADRGIVLCGGGALLRRLDEYLSQEIGVPVIVAKEPMKCAARGSSLFLKQPGFRHAEALPAYTT